jgi:hypothetical protein
MYHIAVAGQVMRRGEAAPLYTLSTPQTQQARTSHPKIKAGIICRPLMFERRSLRCLLAFLPFFSHLLYTGDSKRHD